MPSPASTARPEPDGILAPGRNCWRREPAGRVAFLVDAAAYFAAVAAAVERAERSILILGWDLHSRVRLRRGGNASQAELGALLDAAARRPGLHVNVLRLGLRVLLCPRARAAAGVHLRLADASTGPLSARRRSSGWCLAPSEAGRRRRSRRVRRRHRPGRGALDTPEHRADDPRRVDPGVGQYPPFHDVQVALDGAAAAALGDLARERWRRATGRRLPRPVVRGDRWPSELVPDVRDVAVAIARTEPAWRDRPEIREAEALWLDAIAAARRWLYVETQYLTADRIGAALAARLGEADGPEVVIVTPRECSGWLEESTMGVLRARLVERLRAADRFGRLRSTARSCPAGTRPSP